MITDLKPYIDRPVEMRGANGESRIVQIKRVFEDRVLYYYRRESFEHLLSAPATFHPLVPLK